MPLDVLALPRSRGIVLAAVVPDDGRAGKPGTLALVAEDGARFRFPAEHALVRVDVVDGREGDDPHARLSDLRRRLEPFSQWLAIQGVAAPGARLSVGDVADLFGLPGIEGVLSVALGVAGAAPWVRRDGAELVVVEPRDALEQLFLLSDERFRRKGDDVLADWWPKRAEGVPDGWMDAAGDVGVRARIGLERANFFDVDYAPDEEVAAAAALAALHDFAVAGDLAADAQGRDLARRLGLPDDPDHVLEQLVDCGAAAAALDPAPERAGLAAAFSDEALREVSALVGAPEEPSGREDLTGLYTVAVDDAGTREVDDAISLRRLDDGWELLVHIADVASAIPPGSELDTVACERASSLFLPDRSVLMLPAELVVDRLSLSSDVGRAALTGAFRVSDDGTVLSARFTRSIVRLDRRVGYAETRDPAVLGETEDEARALIALAEALRAARAAAGARILDVPSPKVVVEDGEPRVGRRVQDTPGDLVVSECMVLFNAQAGAALAAAGVGAIFRGQEPGARPARPVPARDDPLYDCRVRRTFAPTVVSAVPLDHEGLGVGAYAQCTSPIRRYADLVNQRQLAALLDGGEPPAVAESLSVLIPDLHTRERRVRRAADLRSAYWTARAIQADGRSTLRGVLSKAPRRGLGSVWVPDLVRELPLRAPKGWSAPPEGTEAEWRIGAIRPFRGRIELEPTD